MGSGFATGVLVLDAVWFGMGFWFFALRARRAVRILVPRPAESETSAHALAASLPFLGGLNLGYAALAVVLLFSRALSPAASPSWHIYLAFTVAHATQWAYNLPHLRRGGRAGGAPWDVSRGPVLFIFIMDAVCAVSNLLALLTFVV